MKRKKTTAVLKSNRRVSNSKAIGVLKSNEAVPASTARSNLKSIDTVPQSIKATTLLKSKQKLPQSEAIVGVKSTACLPQIDYAIIQQLRSAYYEYDDAWRTKAKLELAYKAKERRFIATAFGMKPKNKGGTIVNELMDEMLIDYRAAKRYELARFRNPATAAPKVASGRLVRLIEQDAAAFLADNYELLGAHDARAKGKNHRPLETQQKNVPHANGHVNSEIQLTSASQNGKGHGRRELHRNSANGNGHHHPEIQNGIAARDQLVNFINSLRPYLHAIEPLLREAEDREGKLKKLAVQLPVWDKWAKDVKGLGEASLGQIIGASVTWDPVNRRVRTIHDYPSPAHLWKRFGLGLVNYDDGSQEIQRKCKDKKKAEAHRYSPTKRALMHVVGDCLMKHGGHYKDIYDERKAIEEARYPEWATEKTKDGSKAHPGHYHKRAMRYMEKRLLKDLWIQWHIAVGLGDRIRTSTTLKSTIGVSDELRPSVG